MNLRIFPHLIFVWACISFVSASGAPVQQTDPLLNALVSSPWSWIRPDKQTTGTVTFTPGGKVTQNTPGTRWQGAWERTGPLTIVITHDRKYKWTLQFDAAHLSFNGHSGRIHAPVRGARLQVPSASTVPLTPPVAKPPAQMPVSAASLRPLQRVETDSSLSRIEVIKQQGPNATEWVLTPLNEAIPSDIRQNLTFLREDLLDEGKNTPKATAEAYKLASEYCDKILASLDQRDVARVNAGYRDAQADANKDSSNQALDARRNYKMSWPQYAREESQRAALRENEADKADVKKQQTKVEWATRAEKMRFYLDDLYTAFREALRH